MNPLQSSAVINLPGVYKVYEPNNIDLALSSEKSRSPDGKKAIAHFHEIPRVLTSGKFLLQEKIWVLTVRERYMSCSTFILKSVTGSRPQSPRLQETVSKGGI
jgi:hypothetical protein